jgi:integrase/recombinase XerD
MSPTAGTRPEELVEHVTDFRRYLGDLGYSTSAAKKHGYLLVQLARWLDGESAVIGELTASRAEEFFRWRRALGKVNLRTPRSLAPLFAYLREVGICEMQPASVPADPVEAFLADYRVHLVAERGLVEDSARFYLHVARLLVAERGLAWTTLDAKEVTTFTARTCRGRSTSSARQVVSALRCLMRFLLKEGRTSLELDAAVLSVAGASSSLPRGVSAATVDALLDSCDRTSAIGIRDYAIVLLLCRLGLRGGEVIGLCLEDIDWRAGELVVTGKGGRHDRLPLLPDVGAALADYLERARPRVEARAVFLRQCAPIRGLGETGAIRAVLERACAKAGIAYVNPHRLRHTVATEMLDAGVSLRDIGEVLGHRGVAATATYAKVDLARLRPLACSWPQVTR